MGVSQVWFLKKHTDDGVRYVQCYAIRVDSLCSAGFVLICGRIAQLHLFSFAMRGFMCCCLWTYVFLLRLPSDALPVVVAADWGGLEAQ